MAVSSETRVNFVGQFATRRNFVPTHNEERGTSRWKLLVDKVLITALALTLSGSDSRPPSVKEAVAPTGPDIAGPISPGVDRVIYNPHAGNKDRVKGGASVKPVSQPQLPVFDPRDEPNGRGFGGIHTSVFGKDR
jgi:hypothetical protein